MINYGGYCNRYPPIFYGEIKMLIKNERLKSQTLTVSTEISKTNKVVLDENGIVDLPEESAKLLLQVPNFEIVSETEQAIIDIEKTLNSNEQLKEEPKKKVKK